MKALFKFVFNVNALLVITSFISTCFIKNGDSYLKILVGLLPLLPFFLVDIGSVEKWITNFVKIALVLFLFFQSVVNLFFVEFALTSDFSDQGASEVIYLKEINALLTVTCGYLIIAAIILLIRILLKRRQQL